MPDAEYHLCDIHAEDEPNLARAVALFSRCLGEGYITRDELRQYAQQGGLHAVIHEPTQHLAGVATARLLDAPPDWALGLDLSLPLGHFKSFAVDPLHRRRGLGGMLVDAAIHQLDKRGVRSVVSLSWQGRPGENSLGVLKKAGFFAARTIPDFWRDDSLAQGYDCPACGGPPCRCSATVCWRTLGGSAHLPGGAQGESQAGPL